MKTYEFSLVASGLDATADDFEQRFYDAGCDDATISFQKGHIIIDFAREAETIDDAIASAIEGVIAAGASVDHIAHPTWTEPPQQSSDSSTATAHDLLSP